MGVAMPPTLEAYYYIYVAKGYRTFEQFGLATTSIVRAIDVATANQIGPAPFEEEQLIGGIKREAARGARGSRG